MNLYLSTDSPVFAPSVFRGAWDATGSAVTKSLQRKREGCGNITSIQVAETNAGANWDVLLYRGVSERMIAQTLTGNFDVVLGVDETDVAADMVYHIHVYVTAGDTDTVRGTLVNDYIDATEWPTTAAGRALAATQAYGALAVQDGDRIVVEIGYQAQNAVATSYSGRLRYGTLLSNVIVTLLPAASTAVTTRSGYLSFSNEITFQNAQPPGLCVLTATFLGENFSGLSPVVSPPVGVEEYDILVMGVTHKSGAYATFPGDWTLIAQDVEAISGTRLETYWKRAAALEALQTYSITGLADSACGTIRLYRGGIRSGNPIDAVITQVNGVSPNKSITGLVTTVPNTVLCLFAGQSLTTAPSEPNDNAADDTDVRFRIVASAADLTGSDSRNDLAETMKPTAGALGLLTWNVNPWCANILTVFAIKPETVGVGVVSTRYYLGNNCPGRAEWRDEYPVGAWNRMQAWGTDFGMTAGMRTMELSQLHVRCGVQNTLSISTDQPNDTILIARCLTPPLAAQTIDGTFDLCFYIGAAMNDSAHFPTSSYKVRWKIHAYISVGDTAAVRHTLLNDFIDTVDWSTTGTWYGLGSPPTMSSGACLAGDRVVIEIGIWNRVLPTIVPTYPPSLWGFARVEGAGTARQQTLMAWDDAVKAIVFNNTTNLLLGSYFEFSHIFVEQALPTGPTNISRATAINITTVPYTDGPYSTKNAGTPGSTVWYRFVAPKTKRYFFTSLGSNYSAFVGILKSPNFDVNAAGMVIQAGGIWGSGGGSVGWGGKCDWMAIIDMEAGAEYFIYLITESNTNSGLPGGGALRLSVYEYQEPQADDVYVPMGVLYAFRDGLIVNACPLFRSNAPAGVAIDFSGTPMYDFNTGAVTNTNPRVYVGLFANDIVEIVDGLSLNPAGPEVNYIAGAFEAGGGGDTGPNNVATLDIVAGQLVLGFFGNGFHYVNGASNQSVSAFFNNVCGDVWQDAIRECSAFATDGDGNPPASGIRYQAAPQKTAPWHIRVHPGNTDLIYYVSGGDYVDESQINSVLTSHRCDTIKVWSRSSGQQADFAVVPLALGGPHEGLYGIDIHPNGDVLVCNGTQVDRLNSGGAVVQSYIPNVALKSLSIFAVRYTSTGEKFWAFDLNTATLWQFRVSDGAILQMVDTYGPGPITTQMAIWLPNGIVPPEPPEPAEGRPACPIPGPAVVSGQSACPAPAPSVV